MPEQAPGGPPSGQPSFWNELYWFVAIGLIGWIVAAMALPPRVAEMTRLLRQERRVIADTRALEAEENLLEAAVSAMENDPFYREGMFRARLGLKKDSEEYLQGPGLPVR